MDLLCRRLPSLPLRLQAGGGGRGGEGEKKEAEGEQEVGQEGSGDQGSSPNCPRASL